MKYDEFFKAFYIGGSAGVIVGYKSKEKIPEFIMEHALKEEYWDLLPTSSSTYAKWLDGRRTPAGTIWSRIVDSFCDGQEDAFIDALADELDSKHISHIVTALSIRLKNGERPDKRLIAYAAAKQLFEIAAGNGEGADIAADSYKPEANIKTFPHYAERAIKKYSKVVLPFTESEQSSMDDIYVCNRLSSRAEGAAKNVRRGAVTAITDASLEKIAAYSIYTVLVANGGMGKSMLLRHLLIDSLKRHEESGILPILVELRDFSSETDLLLDCIWKAVEVLDESFTQKDLRDLMISGKCQLLLDGVDEIDQSDAETFRKKLTELIDRYPENQYVMTSRECDALSSLGGFSRLYLQKFNEDQASELIDNLIPDPEVKADILEFIQEAFSKRHKIFASNPMLLTFVVLNYPFEENFEGKKYRFYDAAYDALTRIHDLSKDAYGRIYHSARDTEEFTRVFREFCAITYRDRVSEFDQSSFERYFNRLKTKDQLFNPSTMTKGNFIHDACATACMMYEENRKILYIDSGFQEFMFAEYYYLADPDIAEECGKTFWNVSEAQINGTDAFDMLCEVSVEKAEASLFVPYLKEIFDGESEDAAFIRFMRTGYGNLVYNVMDTALIDKYAAAKEAEWMPMQPDVLEPSNVIFSVLLKQLGLKGSLCFEVAGEPLNYPGSMRGAIVGVDYYDTSDRKNKITPCKMSQQDAEKNAMPADKKFLDGFVRDESKRLVLFGREYEIDLNAAMQQPELFQPMVELVKTEAVDLWQSYCRVRTYYEELKEKFGGDMVMTV